jgi:hypothetical protein
MQCHDDYAEIHSKSEACGAGGLGTLQIDEMKDIPG